MQKEIDGMVTIQRLINHKYKNMKYQKKKEKKQEYKKVNKQNQEIWMMNLKIMELVNIKLK